MMAENYFDRALPYLKKWSFSVLMLIPTWIVIEQFWMALSNNILMAVNYPYPFFIWPLMFIIDNLTLIIHESGHAIFGLFGWRFLGILGGTLMQLLIPFLILVYGWFNKKMIVTQFSMFWLGFAWLDSAAYCADAKWRDLPLIGNLPKSSHDYYNLLTKLDLLEQYQTVAWIMFVIGFLILLMGLIWPLIHKEEPDYVDLSAELEKSGLD